MVINHGNLQSLFTSFNTAFNKGYETAESHYQDIAMVVQSGSAEEMYTWLGQFPTLREWIGEREIQSLFLNSYKIINKDFELTLGVPRNDVMDDRIGIYKPLMQNMGEQVKQHPDELLFNLILKGFTEKCYDGQSFFSNAHPWGKGATQSNLSDKKLTPENYGNARVSMMSIKGEHGRILKIKPNLLLVPPSLETEARKILFSDLVDGSSNPYKDTADLIVAPELQNKPDAWFLLSTKVSLRPFIFQEREKPKFVSKTNDSDDSVFYRKEYIYGVDSRYNAGFGLWQLAFGSTGTNE